jgi:hypothetical protein
MTKRPPAASVSRCRSIWASRSIAATEDAGDHAGVCRQRRRRHADEIDVWSPLARERLEHEQVTVAAADQYEAGGARMKDQGRRTNERTLRSFALHP